MSHVRDGELHMYLDGALEHLGEARAEEVRRHLEGCARCQARLEEEQSVREKAHRLLEGVGGDDELPLPSLEELRRQAAGRRAGEEEESRGTPRLLLLGWAASVVLALGVGLYAPGLPRPGVTPPSPPALSSERATEPEQDERPNGGRVDRLAEPGPGDQGEGADAFRDAASGADPDPATGERAIQPEALAHEGRAEAEPEADEARDARAAEISEGPGPAEAGEAAAAGPGNLARRARSAPAPPADERRVAREGPEAESAEDLPTPSLPEAGEASEADRPTAAPAPSALEEATVRAPVRAQDLLSVPGFPIVAVERVPFPEGRGPGVRVLQALEGGDTLEVLYLPEPLAPEEAEGPPEAWSQVARRVAGGWLLLRAPRTVTFLESLVGLLP